MTAKHTLEVIRLTPETVERAACTETAKAMLGTPGAVIVVKGMHVGMLTTLGTLGGTVLGGTVFRIVKP